MRQRNLGDWWRAVLMLWLIQVMLTPFLAVNALDHPWVLRGVGLVAVVLAACWRRWPRWRVLWVLALVGASLGSWCALLPDMAKNNRNLWTLGRELAQAWQGFVTRGGVNVATLLAALLGLLFALALAVLGVRYAHPYLALLLVLWYLLMVHAINGNALVAESLQVMAIACLINAGSWQGGLGRGAVAAMIALVAVLGVAHGSSVLDTATVPVRNWVNASGLYDVLLAMTEDTPRTGYSDNDTTLGGPVYDDTTPVFTVATKTPLYLRVTVKTDYSGRGWQEGPLSRDQVQTLTLDNGILTGIKDAKAAAYAAGQAVTITAKTPVDYFGLPNGDVSITAVSPGSFNDLFYAADFARLFRGQSGGIKKLSLRVKPKKRDAAALRQVGDRATEGRTVQLPEKLPARIKQLATRVTAGATNDYDRAVAIEQFLKTDPRFTYSKVDTPKTPKGRDYVDHFLFTSKVGYCDNFSSAMVVMLRTLGVPARWAKGFNQGTAIGNDTYAITNANAHSWPEVYFGPKYGWIDFEPTPGFGSSAATPLTLQTSESASSVGASASSQSTASGKSALQAASQSSATVQQTQAAEGHGLWRWALAVIAAALLLVAWLLRRKLVARLAAVALTPQNFPRRYRLLLYALGGVRRRPSGQNLVDYAAAIEARLPLDGAFTTLTAAYEASVFGHHQAVPLAAFRRVSRGLPWLARRL
ncbi:DUF4129 domain-containing transglutaminase family protein [Lacticaseibacillus suihuaensis]